MDQAEAELRARMLLEECTETMAALLGRDMAMTMMVRRVHEMEDLPAGGSVEGIADGLADVMVIVLGTAVTVGIDLEPVFNEVMDANDRKCGPGARVRADGKLLKPIDWRGPDVAGVLARQKGQQVARMPDCPKCGADTAIDGTTHAVCLGGCGWSRRLWHG
jgi:predicted HAD superfamily Cof-like phosphohydrolase